MRKTWFAAIAAVVCSAGAWGQAPVVFRSSEIRAVLRDGSTVVSVPLDNSSDRTLSGDLSLAWLDPEGTILSSQSLAVTILPGRSTFEAPLRLPRSSIWLRLRYSLTPSSTSPRAFLAQEGVTALSQIAGHVFELKTAQEGRVRAGATFTIHAQAMHPHTRQPVSDVKWSAVYRVGTERLSPLRIVQAGGGFVDFVFLQPAASPGDSSDSGSVSIAGELGDFKSTQIRDTRVDESLEARIQTDKPIYQPGQTIHMRAILLGDQGKPAAGLKVKLEVQATDGDNSHSANLTASRFGVVAEDWTIPQDAGLGTYRIEISTEEDGDSIGAHFVRVSRYQLPQFSVLAKPDKAAYLPGDTATVEIRGTYLFGKPVSGATVRLEESDETVAEGQANRDGIYSVKLDLTKYTKELLAWMRFQDLRYAAYLTEPGSGRTEQTKFDLRISREPIHVYLLASPASGPLPAPLYVSTSYADGRPAETAVEIQLGSQRLSARTNRFGVGRAEYLPLPAEKFETIDLRAVDSSGAVGTHSENFFAFEGPLLRVDTDRTLFHAGEAVTVRVSAPGKQDGAVMISAVAGSQLLSSRVAAVHAGKGEVAFPYQPEFQGSVAFVAWTGGEAQGSRSVIFPEEPGVRMALSAGKTSYRPGEKAALQMTVNSVDGKPVESVLGVAIVDQAVMERARTDQTFGHRWWFDCQLCSRGDEIGGLTLQDLTHLDFSQPLPEGLDLVAEMLSLGSVPGEGWQLSQSIEGPQVTFRKTFKSQIDQLTNALNAEYARSSDYPKDEAALNRLADSTWLGLRDPWGEPYRANFITRGDSDVMQILSAGPDQSFGTPDDFSIGEIKRPYFLPVRKLIADFLADDYPASTGEFQAILAAKGLQFDKLRDPWGSAYRVDVRARLGRRTITIQTAGPDRKFGTLDDAIVATLEGSAFQRETAAISKALAAATVIPATEEDFRKILEAAGIDVDSYRDPWGRPYRIIVSESAQYTDARRYSTVKSYQGPAENRVETVPVTRHIRTFALHSAGEDGLQSTYDDYDVARFPLQVSEGSAAGTIASPPRTPVAVDGKGSIAGIVTDVTGASISGAHVDLLDTKFTTQTEEDGSFRFDDLPPGLYSIRVGLPGFRNYRMEDIPVRAGQTTIADVELQVGTVAETVTVTEAAASLQTEASELASLLSTPRVRDYFPETLLWAPEVQTDAQGRARLQFALADSVTTWKIAAIASTLDGRIVEAETSLRAFQPFFLEFNPPPVLTSGDRIDLPVAVRNYTTGPLHVTARFAPNDALRPRGPAARTLSVDSNASVNAVYSIRAMRFGEAIPQRISAAAGRNRDAIEKPLRVHPDGQQISQSFGDIASAPVRFSVAVPGNAIPGATRAELRLYPNLLALLLESAQGILDAPHGCAEQTLSAGYSNLTALRYARAIGVTDPRMIQIATANINLTKEALPGFEDGDGGVSYWRDARDPDIAVTAYALNFLADASSLVNVDTDEMGRIAGWLAKSQEPGGQWGKPKPSMMITALVTRALTAAQKLGVKVPPEVLTAAFRALSGSAPQPYVLALAAQSAMDSANEAATASMIQRLVGMGRAEKGALYWDEESNTPFFGWGTAGRMETSAQAISALARWRAGHAEAADLDPVIRRGLVFLLRSRDSLGGWYSSQATLRAMQAVSDAEGALNDLAGSGGGVEIRINGKSVRTVLFPSDPRASDPLRIDVSSWLSPGENRVEVAPMAGSRAALMQLTERHWVPWSESGLRKSGELKLAVHFDRTHAAPGQPIDCSVTAERVGFRGYGMMLAEVGLPPGAEVDRASLEALRGVDRYDVLPDRVIFYLWPSAGGVTFHFTLRARLPIEAKSEPSRLYDYYNPDALTEVAPQTFEIQ